MVLRVTAENLRNLALNDEVYVVLHTKKGRKIDAILSYILHRIHEERAITFATKTTVPQFSLQI